LSLYRGRRCGTHHPETPSLQVPGSLRRRPDPGRVMFRHSFGRCPRPFTGEEFSDDPHQVLHGEAPRPGETRVVRVSRSCRGGVTPES
jgi:hypothetical protein